MKLGGCILLLRNTRAPLKTNMIGWKIPMFNRKYIFKWRIFHCHVSFRGGVGPIIIPNIRQFPSICSLKLLDFLWLSNTAGWVSKKWASIAWIFRLRPHRRKLTPRRSEEETSRQRPFLRQFRIQGSVFFQESEILTTPRWV